MTCSCCSACTEQTTTYGYADSIPAAPAACDCPCSSNCDGTYILFNQCGTSNPCTVMSPGPGDCAGDTLDCYVRSQDFPGACTQPNATVYINSTLDDYGTISGATQTITVSDACPTALALGNVTATTTITPHTVNNGDGTQYLKLNVHVVNSPNAGGPYGVASLSVRWWFGT